MTAVERSPTERDRIRSPIVGIPGFWPPSEQITSH